MSSQPNRRGYILLMVMAMIALAAIAAAGLARHSLLLALEAVRAEEDLQYRWGAISCQQACLTKAERLLQQPGPNDNDAKSPPCARSISAQVVLGGVKFQLLLADEEAKVSLNTVYAWQGREGVERTLRAASASQGVLEVQLRPYRSGGRDGDFPAFDSWGQVFALDTARPEAPAARSLAETTQELTCWGTGRLNLKSAPQQSLDSVVRLVLAGREAEQFLTVLQQSPELSLDDLLRKVGVSGRESDDLRQLFTDRSHCYSLWLRAEGKHRSWSRLTIGQSEEGRPLQMSCFDW